MAETAMLQSGMTIPVHVAQLSDLELLAEVGRRQTRARRDGPAHRAARGAGRAAALSRAGCSSLFTYCTQVLRLSEHAAYGRIEAARAARRFPVILEWLADGRSTSPRSGLLAPHLTPDNHRDVLDAARHKSKRDVEHLVARLRPQPAVPSRCASCRPRHRRPAPVAGRSRAAPHGDASRRVAPPPAPAPPMRRRSRPSATRCSSPCRARRTRSCAASRTAASHIPSGDPAAIFDRALTLLLADLERTKLAATDGHASRTPVLHRLAPHSGGGQAGRLGSRWRPVRFRRSTRAAAPSAASSNSTTSCRTPPVVQRRPRTSSCVAAPQRGTRRSSISGVVSRCWC